MRIPATPYRPPSAPAAKPKEAGPGSVSAGTQKDAGTPTRSWKKPATPDAMKQVDTTSEEEKLDSYKDAPYQLRHIKQNWNLSYVPKGAVSDRIKVFAGGHNRSLESEDHGLTNTGRTNPALRKRRELERQEEMDRQREAEERRKRAESKYGFGRTKKAKAMAATAMQSIVRMHFAKAVAARKREQAEARAKKDKLLAAERAELEHKTKAAIKIQAVMRSAVTRVRVCRMVEDMIAGLSQQQIDEARRLERLEIEAGARAAAKKKEEEAEKERLAQAAEAEARRLQELESDADALATEKRKQQQAEEERLALAALAREQREAAAGELAEQKASAEAAKEAQRLARLEEERKRKEAIALEREKRRKEMNLFTGPLPWGCALLPDWWMAEVPHNDFFLDSIKEEDNGEDFEEWRKGNLEQAA